MKKIKKITSLFLAAMLILTSLSVGVMAEGERISPDVRFDFISSADGVINITGAATATVENGEFVVTTNSMNLANKQFHIELPQFDFGDGGYYMYAKISADLPNGTQFNDSIWGTQTTAGRDYVSAQGGNSWTSWDGTEKVRRFNTTSITGEKYLRMIYMMSSSAVTGVAEFHIDWIVLSKNANLNESTAVVDSFNDGSRDIVLAQNGDMMEAIVTRGVYDNLTVGTTYGLPSDFTAELTSGVSNPSYRTVVTDKENYKIVDIDVWATKNGNDAYRQYRLIVSPEEGLAIPANDIRFDFISGAEGVINITGAATGAAGNGEFVVTTNSINLANKQFHIELPQIDFGSGGYYMYAKISADIPDGIQFSDSQWGTQTTAGRDYVAVSGGNNWTAWDGTPMIRKFNMTSVTGEQYARIMYFMQNTAITGVAEFHIDWVVLSKNANLNDTTATLSSVNDGTNDIVLVQDGSANEITVDSETYSQFEAGVIDELPAGFTAETASGVTDIVYHTTITENEGCKIIDIATSAKKNDNFLQRQYRIIVKEERECVALTPDIRFDFTEGTENFTNITVNSASFKAENGEIIVTTKEGNMANRQFHIELPQIDFGDGGYYLYAKISADLPEGSQFADSMWGSQTDPGLDWVRAQGGNDWAAWDGTEKVRRFNTSSITGEQYVRLIYMMGSSSVTGVAEFHIDWVVLSKNSSLNNLNSVVEEITIGGDDYALPQDGSPLLLDLRTSVYNNTTDNNNELPEGWSIASSDDILYEATVTEKADYKVIDLVASNPDVCRTYRVIAKLDELELTTALGTAVTVPGAINIIDNGDHEYECELYPKEYDLLVAGDVVLESAASGEVVSVERGSTSCTVVICDADGNESFRLECQKIRSSNTVVLDSVNFNNGTVSYTGTISGSADDDEVVVAAFGANGTDVLARGTAEIEEDGTFAGEFTIDEITSGSNYFDMKVAAYVCDTECSQTVKYYTSSVLATAIAEVKAYNGGTQIFTAIKNSSYRALFDTMGIWTTSTANETAVNQLLSTYSNTLTVEEFTNVVNGTIILSEAKRATSKENIISLLNQYDREINAISISDISFSDLETAGKNTVVDTLWSNSTSATWADYKNKVRERMLFHIIANETDYKAVDGYILENTDVIMYPNTAITGTALESLNNANSDYADSIMRTLVNLQGSAMFATSQELLNDLALAIRNTPQPGQTDGGGGGGGFGGAGSNVTVMVNPNNEVTPTPKPNSGKFNDLSGYAWAETAIYDLSSKGIVSGVGDGRYEPGRNITREEFVKLVYEALDFELVDTSVDFKDVNANDWYAPYVANAIRIGLINGISEDKFGAGSMISREDMAVILYRAMCIKGYSFAGAKADFADGTQISGYATDAVSNLGGKGIINGVGNDMFSPKTSATRAEAAVIICRSMNAF